MIYVTVWPTDITVDVLVFPCDVEGFVYSGVPDVGKDDFEFWEAFSYYVYLSWVGVIQIIVLDGIPAW